jgi:hypothetical protein
MDEIKEFFTNPIVILSSIFAGILYGFFKTKTGGFGKYTTSLLLLLFVTYCATIAIIVQKQDWPSFANLLFAVAGFAGGLVTPKTDS